MKIRRPRVKEKIGRIRAIARYFRDPSASILGKLFVFAALAYVISPVDLVPDVPVVGWLDDMGVMSLAVAFMWKIVGRYREPRELPEAGGAAGEGSVEPASA